MTTLAEIEKAVILERLILVHFDILKCAKSLDISKNTVYRRLLAWGMRPRGQWEAFSVKEVRARVEKELSSLQR